jgi:hypothetical protein
MDYPNTGAFFTTKEKRHEKSPDMYGELDIDKELVLDLIQKAGNSDSIKIKLGGWLRRDKNNNRMLSVKVDTYSAPQQAKSSAKDPWDD